MASIVERLRGLTGSRPRGRFTAVDFDSRQVRIVQAEHTADGVRILKMIAGAMPDGLDVEDPEAVGRFLGEALAQSKLGSSGILMNVPRGQAVLKPLTLPPAETTGELAAMVHFQVEKELPFPGTEAAIDFTTETHYDAEGAAEGEESGVQVLVAAVRHGVVEHYQKIAEAAGVKLLRLGLRPYADQRAVQAYAPAADRATLAVLHLTADEVEIDVLAGSSLAFSRSAVARVVPGPGPQGADAGADEDAPADPLDMVVMEVARSLRSYQAVQRGKRIEAVLVAGGTGLEDEVAAEIDRRLGLECVRFDPGRSLGLPEGGTETSAFISALGLAIAHQHGEALPYDFLHPKRPPVEKNQVLRVGVGASIAAGMVLVAALVGGAWYRHSKQARVDALVERLGLLKTENKAVAELGSFVSKVRGWSEAGRPWLDHWARTSGLFPPCSEVYIAALDAAPDGTMSFSVRAASTDILDQLGEELIEAGYNFRPGQVTTVKSEPRYPFSTNVRLLVDTKTEVDLAAIEPEPRPKDDASAELLARGKDLRRIETVQVPVPTPEVRPAESPTPAPTDRDALRQKILETYDADKDGKLSRAEGVRAYSDILRNPGPWDTDGDGQISRDERSGIYRFIRRMRGD